MRGDDNSEESASVFIVIIVLDIILYIIVSIFTIFVNIFNARSIIITEYYIVSYSSAFKSIFNLAPSYILFLSFVLPLFTTKFVYLVISLHLLFCILLTVWVFWIPFGKRKMNSFIGSVLISSLVSDIFCLTKLHSKWCRYLIVLGLILALSILMDFLMKVRIKKIIMIKKINEKENKEEAEEKYYGLIKPNMHLENPLQSSYNLSDFKNMSISKALFVLRIAIIYKSTIFSDGKFLDLITSLIETTKDKISLAHLICYFPEFQPIFFALLTGLKRVRYLPTMLEFELFQLRRFDICLHPDAKIDDLDEVIQESEALSMRIRSFWQIIESECNSMNDFDTKNNKKLKTNLFKSFDLLSRSVFNCNNKWRSFLNFYPNNIQIVDEYMKFLIECKGDYMGAMEYKTVSSLIQEGKTYKINTVHLSFLRAYPYYAKEIFPWKSIIRGIDDMDYHRKIESFESLIEMPEARIEYQRSTSSSLYISINTFFFLALASLLYIFIFWVYEMCTFKYFLHMTESMDFILNTSRLSQQISLNFISTILFLGQNPSDVITPTSEEIFSELYLDNFSDRLDDKNIRSLIKLDDNYREQIISTSHSGMELINYLHNAALVQIEKGNFFQVVINTFYNNIDTYYYHSSNQSVLEQSNIQSLLMFYFTHYHALTYENLTINNSEDFYHATISGSNILDNLDDVSISALKNNEFIIAERKSRYSVELYILSACYIFISCILVIIDVIFIRKIFDSITNSLLYFPKNVVKKAFNPLIKKSHSNSDSNNNNSNASFSNINGINGINNNQADEESDVDIGILMTVQSKISNFILISIIISIILSIGLAGFILGFHFMYDKYKYNFTSINELVHYYSLETSQLLEILYLVMASNTFENWIPSLNSTFESQLTKSIEDIKKTHYSCWNYSVQGDCGIKGERLNAINNLKNQQKCPEDWKDKSYHELIGCLSEESGFNAFIDITESLYENIDNHELFSTDLFKQYLHFVLSHLYYDIEMFSHYLIDGAKTKQTDYVIRIQTFGSVSIVIAFFLYIFNSYIYIKIKKTFGLLFTFISRVSPADIILNNNLMKYLFGVSNNNKSSNSDSRISFLVKDSPTPIIFLDRSAVIEFVNSSFSHKFGYEANFIVGQPISTLIEDESILYFIDTLKFFETRRSSVKTIACKKGNGNKTMFEITFIPIHNSLNKDSKQKSVSKSSLFKEKDANSGKNSPDANDDDDDDESGDYRNTFVHRIALVFVEKTNEKNLEKKCHAMKAANNKILESLFPPILNLCSEGFLRMCAVCLIKFSNAFTKDVSSSRILLQRQNLYEMIYDKIKIYSLLIPVDCKNGLFTAVGCRKSDPSELAIECLNFAFTIINEINHLMTKNTSNTSLGLKFTGNFFTVIETGGELNVGWSGDQFKKVLIGGELMDRALKVLDYASLAGNVCVSKKTYEYIVQHDYSFVKKEIPEEICGEKFIYAIDIIKNDAMFNSNSNSNESVREYSNDSGNDPLLPVSSREESD